MNPRDMSNEQLAERMYVNRWGIGSEMHDLICEAARRLRESAARAERAEAELKKWQHWYGETYKAWLAERTGRLCGQQLDEEEMYQMRQRADHIHGEACSALYSRRSADTTEEQPYKGSPLEKIDTLTDSVSRLRIGIKTALGFLESDDANAKRDAVTFLKAALSPAKAVACRATIEIENGEYVSPCHKPKGHDGQHEGYCLGSKAVWTDDTPDAGGAA